MTDEIRDIEDVLPSDWVNAEDCILQTLILHGIMDRRDGQYGEFLIVQTTRNDELVNVSFGGEVVIRQLQELASRDAFPVRAMLVKNTSNQGREFYQLVSPENAPS